MFLANENFPRPSVLFLREHGHTILSIQELHQGWSDIEVLQKARLEHLVILTFDKDYGELIFRYAIKNPPSVIFFRVKGRGPAFVGQILQEIITSNRIQFQNAFTVIDENNIRQRFYTE